MTRLRRHLLRPIIPISAGALTVLTLVVLSLGASGVASASADDSATVTVKVAIFDEATDSEAMLPGATVHLQSDGVDVAATSDQDGVATLTGVPYGNGYTIVADWMGDPDDLTTAPGQDSPTEIVDPEPLSVDGAEVEGPTETFTGSFGYVEANVVAMDTSTDPPTQLTDLSGATLRLTDAGSQVQQLALASDGAIVFAASPTNESENNLDDPCGAVSGNISGYRFSLVPPPGYDLASSQPANGCIYLDTGHNTLESPQPASWTFSVVPASDSSAPPATDTSSPSTTTTPAAIVPASSPPATRTATPKPTSARPAVGSPTALPTPSATSSASPSVAAESPAQSPTQTTPPPPSAPDLQIIVDLVIGEPAAGQPVGLQAEGLESGSTVTTVVHSAPQVLGTVTVGSAGTAAAKYLLPSGLEAGAHSISVSATAADGMPVLHTVHFAVDASGDVASIGVPPTTPIPTPSASDSQPQPQPTKVIGGTTYLTYSVAGHPQQALATQVSIYALLATLAGAGFAGLGALYNGASSARRSAEIAEEGLDAEGSSGSTGKLGGAKVKHTTIRHDAEGRGDRSRTWKWPGAAVIDRASVALTPRLGALSPLAARLASDGVYLRAAFGPLSLLLPLAGAVFGALAAVSAGTYAVPPALWIVVVIVLLGIVDSGAGFLAATVYTLVVLCAGHLDSWDAVRTVLCVDVVFFTAGLAASASRPLRRVPERTGYAIFDRGADIALAALIGAWTMIAVSTALPALSGLQLPLAEHADELALIAGGAILVRYLAETGIVLLYPRRLAHVAPAEFARPGVVQQIVSIACAGALTLLFSIAYTGDSWYLWVGVALSTAVALAGIAATGFPNAPWLVRWVPKGIVKTVVMMLVGVAFAALFAAVVSDSQLRISLGYFVLGLPGVLLTVAGWFAQSGPKWTQSWTTRIGGVLVTAFGILLVEGVISLSF